MWPKWCQSARDNERHQRPWMTSADVQCFFDQSENWMLFFYLSTKVSPLKEYSSDASWRFSHHQADFMHITRQYYGADSNKGYSQQQRKNRNLIFPVDFRIALKILISMFQFRQFTCYRAHTPNALLPTSSRALGCLLVIIVTLRKRNEVPNSSMPGLRSLSRVSKMSEIWIFHFPLLLGVAVRRQCCPCTVSYLTVLLPLV